MSWFSRSGGTWGAGRFSPFGRPSNNPNSAEVTEENYSYITNEDLENQSHMGRHPASSRAAAPEIVEWNDKNPDRDTDVLIFKHGRTNFPTHFPAFSIRDGELMVGTVRQAAAKKMGVNDPSRIRMFYKGRNLKHDERSAREEGLRGDGTGSEILCVIGEAGTGSMAPGSEERSYALDGSDDEDDTEAGDDSGTGAATKKKPRKRGGKKSKKRNASGTESPPAMGYSNSTATNAEFLPIPSHIPSPRPTSTSPQNISRAATPQSPIGKLDALASKFHTEHVPLCVAFMQNPPDDKAKRSFEYKRLSETILSQILLKLDGVETEGDPDARARRKELVREVQGMLNKLDEIVK